MAKTWLSQKSNQKTKKACFATHITRLTSLKYKELLQNNIINSSVKKLDKRYAQFKNK